MLPDVVEPKNPAPKDDLSGSHAESSALSEDDTLIDETNPRTNDHIVIDDWSRTGRGSHVDFDDGENVPLAQGRFLGRGAMGEVHEIDVQGWKLAHKRMTFRRKIGEKEKKEIEILKRLSHIHMVQLIGTYTQQKYLGILLYPVAVCDLHTFFEDVEAWSAVGLEDQSQEARLEALDPDSKARLTALEYDFPTKTTLYKASPVYSKIGCLVSAITYLHDQKIRHKDLKPSNILLSPHRLWLSDFGSATDFTLLSQSATDNERGTPRYFSPEVAKWQPNGRAADIFSLGCIILEILVLHDRGTLEHIRQHRTADPSFHANLDNTNVWLQPFNSISTRRNNLLSEIQNMLSGDPANRPKAKDLLRRITAYDLGRTRLLTPSVFGNCCRQSLIPRQIHEERTTQLKRECKQFKTRLEQLGAVVEAFQDESKAWQGREKALEHKFRELDIHANRQKERCLALERSNLYLESALKRMRESKDSDIEDLAKKLREAQEQSSKQILPDREVSGMLTDNARMLEQDKNRINELESMIAQLRSGLDASLKREAGLHKKIDGLWARQDYEDSAHVATKEATGEEMKTAGAKASPALADYYQLQDLTHPSGLVSGGRKRPSGPVLSSILSVASNSRTSNAGRPADEVVEREFMALMMKRGWQSLPAQAQRQMVAYSIDKKWTLVYQDKLTSNQEQEEGRALRPTWSTNANTTQALRPIPRRTFDSIPDNSGPAIDTSWNPPDPKTYKSDSAPPRRSNVHLNSIYSSESQTGRSSARPTTPLPDYIEYSGGRYVNEEERNRIEKKRATSRQSPGSYDAFSRSEDTRSRQKRSEQPETPPPKKLSLASRAANYLLGEDEPREPIVRSDPGYVVTKKKGSSLR